MDSHKDGDVRRNICLGYFLISHKNVSPEKQNRHLKFCMDSKACFINITLTFFFKKSTVWVKILCPITIKTLMGHTDK